jgi:hypothetical protein
LDYALSIAAEQFDRGEVLDAITIAKLTKKVTAVRHGGIDAAGYEQLASVLARFGTLHDEAEAAHAALKIEPGIGRNPVRPKRPPSWAARHAVVVRDRAARRSPWWPAVAVGAAMGVLFVLSARSGGFGGLSTEEAVHASFVGLVEELGGSPASAAVSSLPNTTEPTNWLSTTLTAFAADFAKGYRRCSSREAAAVDAEEVRKHLLAYAEKEQIKVEFICPPAGPGGTKLIGDYRWPRQMRLCPGISGLAGAELVAHELGHHLQGKAGRLNRKPAEDEADAVSLTALKALGVDIHATDGAYLSKPGAHLPALLASRAAIEAMAGALVEAAGNER